MIHPIPEFDFLSPSTRERVDADNAATDALDNEQAAVERETTALASMNPFEADVDAVEKRSRKLRQQRHANQKAAITLLQARLLLIAAMQQDRQQAEQDVAWQLQEARRQTTEALRGIGYGHLLANTAHFARAQMEEIVSQAQPVIAAAARYQDLRSHLLSLSQLAIETRQEITRLAEGMQQSIKEAVAAV